MGNAYKTYDPNEDYKKKMDEAAAAGDYESAARYEQKRNEKITGEGLTQYQTTDQYAQYLPKSQGSYTPYDPTGSVAQAQQLLQQAMGNRPGAYQGTWETQMQDMIGQILGREPFDYDVNSDALYQQYREQYMRQGALAMEDTMGKAAALTGGYGNSYAQAVGHQAYQGYMDQLNDRIPELYDRAFARYQQEGQDMLDKYALMVSGDDREYGRYQDALSRYFTELGMAQDQYTDERNWQYQLGMDQYAKEQAEQDRAYELALSMLQSGMMPSEAVLSASGLSAEDANKIYNQAKTQAYSGGNTTNPGNYNPNPKPDTDPVDDPGSFDPTTGTLSPAAQNIWNNIRPPYAGSDIDAWYETMDNRIAALVANKTITEEDALILIYRLGLDKW